MAGEAATSTTQDATTSPPPTGVAALPSLNPSDSPYQPLSLPEVKTPAQHPMGEEEPVQNLGATNKAGAFAYIIDKTLRGAVQGYDQSRLQHAQQANKKLSALSALQQQLGQQYVQAYNEAGSSKPGMTPEQILEDPKVKQLHNQLLAVHQTTLDAIGKYLPQLQQDEKGNIKAGKQKNKQNLLQRMFGQEPDESLRAYAEAASKLGPTAFYQVASPQQLAGMYQQRQTAGLTDQNQQTLQQATADRNHVLGIPEDKRTPEDKQKLQSAEDILNASSPTHRATADELKRQDYQAYIKAHPEYKGAFEQWTTEQGTLGRQAATPAKAPKYDNNTGTISDPATGKVYTPTDLNLPLPIASIFKAADNQAFKKQQRALALVAERGQAYLAGRVVQVADPEHPGTTIYMKALDAVRQGVPTPSSIWYKLQMPTGQERGRADLAISAREQLNTMSQILTARKDLFGPVSGRQTDFTKWVGSQDPDAQRFAAAARIAADHLAGVFGGRSKAALDAIYDAVGQNKTNPTAGMAALEQMNIAAAQIQSSGQRPGLVPPPAGGKWTPPQGAPDPKQFPEGFTLHKKGSDEIMAVQRGGQWTQPSQ